MVIEIDDLTDPAVIELLEEHLVDMYATSPPESVHALDVSGLKRPEITFWVAREGGTALGCAALKQIDSGHGEVKSMRTARNARGRGVATTLLAHLMSAARARGYSRLSLETGSMEFFAPARRLYERNGFRYCGPFGSYQEDPNSVFMTRLLHDMEATVEFFDDPEKVEQYISMAEGYDGRELIEQLRRHLPDRSHVLELGMGPGVDLELLKQHFVVTGSDRSKVFVDRYQAKHPEADLLHLDAVSLQTDRTFDCIFSNKVLHHLSRDELRQSFTAQASRVRPGGLLMHSFWVGDGEDTIEGMRFTYHTEETLRESFDRNMREITMERYTEMEPDDSLYVILRRE